MFVFLYAEGCCAEGAGSKGMPKATAKTLNGVAGYFGASTELTEIIWVFISRCEE